MAILFVQNKSFRGNVFVEVEEIRFRGLNRKNKYRLTAIGETPKAWELSFGRYGVFEVPKGRSKQLSDIVRTHPMLAEHRKLRVFKEITVLTGSPEVKEQMLARVEGEKVYFCINGENVEAKYITAFSRKRGEGFVYLGVYEVAGRKVKVTGYHLGQVFNSYLKDIVEAEALKEAQRQAYIASLEVKPKAVARPNQGFEDFFGPQNPQSAKSEQKKLFKELNSGKKDDKKAKRQKASEKARKRQDEVLESLIRL